MIEYFKYRGKSEIMSRKNVVPLYVLIIGAFLINREYLSSYMTPIPSKLPKIIEQFSSVFNNFTNKILVVCFLYVHHTMWRSPAVFWLCPKVNDQKLFLFELWTASCTPHPPPPPPRRLMPKVSFCDLSPEVEVTKIILTERKS
jgi:hypothetical protein